MMDMVKRPDPALRTKASNSIIGCRGFGLHRIPNRLGAICPPLHQRWTTRGQHENTFSSGWQRSLHYFPPWLRGKYRIRNHLVSKRTFVFQFYGQFHVPLAFTGMENVVRMFSATEGSERVDATRHHSQTMGQTVCKGSEVMEPGLGKMA